MKRIAVPFGVAVAALTMPAIIGCQQPHTPDASDTAAYLGLSAGSTLTYNASDGTVETHDVKKSSLLPGKGNTHGLVFDVIAKKSGFVAEERTFSIELSVTDAKIVRVGDCTEQCGTLSQPIALFATPLQAGASTLSELDVTTTGGPAPGTAHESDTIVVGDQQDLGVPAGDFKAFAVSWTKNTGDDVKNATIRIAPDDGIVGWDSFDGTSLELAAR